MKEYSDHYSVLNEEIIRQFSDTGEESDFGLFLDLTFGGGGHSIQLASQLYCKKVLAVDQDIEAVKNGLKLIETSGFNKKISLIQSNFENIEAVHGQEIKSNGGLNGAVLDLGVSSHHFDVAERGFSFNKEAKLDMRMNQMDSKNVSAYEIVNNFPRIKIAEILKDYGEERYFNRLATAITEAREKKKIETTTELAEIIKASYPLPDWKMKIHPATKAFQGIRIYVNRELEVLENTLPKLLGMMKMGGKIAVISFHSLEDRIVKNCFKKAIESVDLPFEYISKKPIVPTEREIIENSRSRSAKLRVIMRVHERRSKNKYAKFSTRES